jgi:hypothetical protein
MSWAEVGNVLFGSGLAGYAGVAMLGVWVGRRYPRADR